MKNTLIKKIGILCEDETDKKCISNFIEKLTQIKNLSISGFNAKGCGLLKRKAKSYATAFKKIGCDMLILVHDLDDLNVDKLKKELTELNCGKGFSHYLICVPVQEMEGWLLSDSKAIRKALRLKKDPKVPPSPELIKSPKEYLRDIIFTTSNKQKRYLSTVDNTKIVTEISINLAETKCPSFKEFSLFIKERLDYFKK